jgi:hypothetical protein
LIFSGVLARQSGGAGGSAISKRWRKLIGVAKRSCAASMAR